jgi:hypothetical protein
MSVFSLSLRLFTAPDLCIHKSHPSEIAVETSAHCHMKAHPKPADAKPKQIPCDHMKQCLLDAGDDDTIFQKSIKSTGIADSTIYAFYVPALSPDLYSASSDAPVWSRPPDVKIVAIPLYLSKSSFLI